MAGVTESTVAQAALAWLESVGWSVRIAPGELAAERSGYGKVVLGQRLRDALLQELISAKLRLRHVERFIERPTA